MSKAKGKHQGLGDAARNIGKPLRCEFRRFALRLTTISVEGTRERNQIGDACREQQHRQR